MSLGIPFRLLFQYYMFPSGRGVVAWKVAVYGALKSFVSVRIRVESVKTPSLAPGSF